MQHNQLRCIVMIALLSFGGSNSFGMPSLTRISLENAVYRSTYVESGEVKLVNGKADVDDPYIKVTVTLTDFVAFGDLNGDGRNDAAVVLVTVAGGTGHFRELAVVLDRKGAMVHVASVMLGDRVKVESINITDGQVRVRMISHKPDDPLCCPTLHVTKAYHLEGSQLFEK